MDKSKDLLCETSAEESLKLMEQFDPQAHIRQETLDRVAARLDAKLPRRKRARFFRSIWKPALAAAAACAAIYLTLGLTVPGVADTLYKLTHPHTTAESYLGELPESRDPVAEIDRAIEQSGAQNGSGCVELLGSYSGALDSDGEYNKLADNDAGEREKLGLPPYDASEYAYLCALRPQIQEVYYDGTRLIMNAYFDCSCAGDFLVGFGNSAAAHTHNLDMMTFDARCVIDGTAFVFGSYAHGVIPDDRRDPDGFTMQTDVDLHNPLPDGVAQMTLYYYIYDEDAGHGNVARVRHTFSFDTTPGNRSRTQTIHAPLSGNAVLTVLRGGGATEDFKTVENRTVPLDGLVLSLDVAYLPGSVAIDVNVDAWPDAFDDEMQWALFSPPDAGLLFDVYVNGARISVTPSGASGGSRMRLELPVHAADYDALQSITLTPKIAHLSSFVPILDARDASVTGESVALLTDAGPAAYPIGGFLMQETAETVLTGCTIELPLPTR